MTQNAYLHSTTSSRFPLPKTSYANRQFCTLGNVFANEMDDHDSADWFGGLIWNTFRDVRHFMKRIVLKIRPNPYNPSGECASHTTRMSSKDVLLTYPDKNISCCPILSLLVFAATVSDPDVDPYKAAYVTGEVGTIYR